jgi:hypothetical protein
MRPIQYLPSFPFNFQWLKYIGIDITLVMPPLPAGNGSQGELPGTDRWCSMYPVARCSRTRLAIFDMSQADESGNVLADHENFWPGLGRWRVGVMMEKATLGLEHPETWEVSEK